MERIEQSLLGAREPYLRYYHALLERGVPAESAGGVHAQRLLVLYLCVVGCDLLRDDWLPAHHHHHHGGSTDGTSHSPPSLLAVRVEEELERCYNAETGGFHPEDVGRFSTPSSVSMTHCAVHVLTVTGRLPCAAERWLRVEKTLEYVLACQCATTGGFFASPDIDETDVRFTYSALMCFALLLPLGTAIQERVERSLRSALPFLLGCWRGAEGGFGASPTAGYESHGGMTFCSAASLAILKALVGVTLPPCFLARLRRYVVNRVARGPEDEALVTSAATCAAIGFQGRPCKSCDSCYTHWLGATLVLLQRPMACTRPVKDAWGEEEEGEVDSAVVARFCVRCLDKDDDACNGLGVIRRSSEDEPDVVHATLGLSGVLLILANGGGCSGGLWGGVAPPHPVYGCSRETATLARLPAVESLLS